MINLDILELITFENLHELKPGEWIWDNKIITRRAHKRSIYCESVQEPTGFRQIHILDIESIPTLKPFMLSNIDNIGFGSGSEWVHFEINRFYKFKNKERKDD